MEPMEPIQSKLDREFKSAIHDPTKATYYAADARKARRRERQRLIRALRHVGQAEEADRVSRCGRVSFLVDGHSGDLAINQKTLDPIFRMRRCYNRLCPTCVALWRSQLTQTMAAVTGFRSTDNLLFLELDTQPTLSNLLKRESELASCAEEVFAALANARLIDGALLIAEAVPSQNGRGWHLHLHVILRRIAFLRPQAIKEAWRATLAQRGLDGGSHVTFPDRQTHVQTLFSYVAKGSAPVMDVQSPKLPALVRWDHCRPLFRHYAPINGTFQLVPCEAADPANFRSSLQRSFGRYSSNLPAQTKTPGFLQGGTGSFPVERAEWRSDRDTGGQGWAALEKRARQKVGTHWKRAKYRQRAVRAQQAQQAYDRRHGIPSVQAPAQ